jgi:hypothetical protein
MVELNHNVTSINADGVIKGGHGVVVAVYVTKKGSSGAKIILKNGITSGGAAEFTVFGEAEGDYDNLHRRFENGIYADVTGSAEYLIVFK